jgi:hypothetical protein
MSDTKLKEYEEQLSNIHNYMLNDNINNYSEEDLCKVWDDLCNLDNALQLLGKSFNICVISSLNMLFFNNNSPNSTPLQNLVGLCGSMKRSCDDRIIDIQRTTPKIITSGTYVKQTKINTIISELEEFNKNKNCSKNMGIDIILK